MTQFVRPITAHEAILGELRRLIVSRELPPGSKIIQEQLANQLGVSRVPVREALKLLEGEGLIRTEPHRGTYVVEVSPEELLQIVQLRGIIETDALAVSLPAIGDDELGTMEACLATMDAAAEVGDSRSLGLANRRFHLAIVEPSGWDRYIRLLNQLWDNSEPYWSYTSSDPEVHARRKAEHTAILAAVRARDLALVAELLDAHRMDAIETTMERLTSR
ncbi:MAG TPA: GntR family transcriptional regulator [Acidimicrobiales bacterium]|nr:GntR family transcriptional regulator [Acidimicrobiales bacterium]